MAKLLWYQLSCSTRANNHRLRVPMWLLRCALLNVKHVTHQTRSVSMARYYSHQHCRRLIDSKYTAPSAPQDFPIAVHNHNSSGEFSNPQIYGTTNPYSSLVVEPKMASQSLSVDFNLARLRRMFYQQEPLYNKQRFEHWFTFSMMINLFPPYVANIETWDADQKTSVIR